MFSFLSPESGHKKTIRRNRCADGEPGLAGAFPGLSGYVFAEGRPSIPPEKLLRALLLQVRYTIRSDLLLMEQLDYNLLLR